mgnify:CR=1 FL=1
MDSGDSFADCLQLKNPNTGQPYPDGTLLRDIPNESVSFLRLEATGPGADLNTYGLVPKTIQSPVTGASITMNTMKLTGQELYDAIGSGLDLEPGSFAVIGTGAGVEQGIIRPQNDGWLSGAYLNAAGLVVRMITPDPVVEPQEVLPAEAAAAVPELPQVEIDETTTLAPEFIHSNPPQVYFSHPSRSDLTLFVELEDNATEEGVGYIKLRQLIYAKYGPEICKHGLNTTNINGDVEKTISIEQLGLA